MLFLRKPTPARIMAFIERQRALPFSYDEVGRSRTGETPPGFRGRHSRCRLGSGPGCFDAAERALADWRMYDLGWTELAEGWTTPVPGVTVGLLVRNAGFWWLNAMRVVFTLEEDDGIRRRIGFAIGTLPEHAMAGEERFIVEWDRSDGSVWYDLLSFSRPNGLLSRVGFMLVRALQRRFAEGSARAMERACQPAPDERSL